MNIRRTIATVAIAGGSLLLSSAPAFAGSETGDTLSNTGTSGSSQNALLFVGGAGVAAGTMLVLVRRKAGARA